MLLGRWLNFEHLEESLTLDELIEIANAIAEKENHNRKFLAAIQGISLDEESGMVDITELNIGEQSQDIVGLKGALAEREGFGIGHGLGYIEV